MSAPVPALIFTLSWLPVAFDALIRALFPPSLYLMKYRILGYFHTRITASVAELGVADALASGPKTAAQLAKELSCDERALFRLLRAAVQANLFKASGGVATPNTTTFTNNAFSACLRFGTRERACQQKKKLRPAVHWCQKSPTPPLQKGGGAFGHAPACLFTAGSRFCIFLGGVRTLATCPPWCVCVGGGGGGGGWGRVFVDRPPRERETLRAQRPPHPTT